MGILEMKKLALAVFACALGVFTAISATAMSLDFDVAAPTSGSFSYAGGIAHLVGTNIEVDTVVGLGTALHNHVTLNLSNAFLNFTTGPSTGDWTWGGGTITVLGGVDSPALSIPDGTTLLSGHIETALVFCFGGSFKIAGAAFFATLNADLLEFYGLPYVLPNGETFPYAGNLNLSFDALCTVPSVGFTSRRMFSGDIVNNAHVPEPLGMVLMGAGLLTWGLVRKMRRRWGRP